MSDSAGRVQSVSVTDLPRYAVIRIAPECRLLVGDWQKWDGLWIELGPVKISTPDDEDEYPFPSGVATATDRFERREDGATARVYEVQP